LWEPEESDDHGYNPSGRFISFSEAVAFLSEYASKREIEQNLRSHVDEFYISVFGLNNDDPSLEDGFFYESQVVGLATVVYGRPFNGWDAISRKRVNKAMPSASVQPPCPPGEELETAVRADTESFVVPPPPPTHGVDGAEPLSQRRAIVPVARDKSSSRNPRELELVVNVRGEKVTVRDEKDGRVTYRHVI
jgi:hypothetical protein